VQFPHSTYDTLLKRAKSAGLTGRAATAEARRRQQQQLTDVAAPKRDEPKPKSSNEQPKPAAERRPEQRRGRSAEPRTYSGHALRAVQEMLPGHAKTLPIPHGVPGGARPVSMPFRYVSQKTFTISAGWRGFFFLSADHLQAGRWAVSNGPDSQNPFSIVSNVTETGNPAQLTGRDSGGTVRSYWNAIDWLSMHDTTAGLTVQHTSAHATVKLTAASGAAANIYAIAADELPTRFGRRKDMAKKPVRTRSDIDADSWTAHPTSLDGFDPQQYITSTVEPYQLFGTAGQAASLALSIPVPTYQTGWQNVGDVVYGSGVQPYNPFSGTITEWVSLASVILFIDNSGGTGPLTGVLQMTKGRHVAVKDSDPWHQLAMPARTGAQYKHQGEIYGGYHGTSRSIDPAGLRAAHADSVKKTLNAALARHSDPRNVTEIANAAAECMGHDVKYKPEESGLTRANPASSHDEPSLAATVLHTAVDHLGAFADKVIGLAGSKAAQTVEKYLPSVAAGLGAFLL